MIMDTRGGETQDTDLTDIYFQDITLIIILALDLYKQNINAHF